MMKASYDVMEFPPLAHKYLLKLLDGHYSRLTAETS